MKPVIARFLIALTGLIPVCSSANSAEKFTYKESRSLEKIIIKLNPKLNKKYVKKIADAARLTAKKHNIDPVLLVSIINTESSFNQRAISSTSDVSIAQINPTVWTPVYFKKVTGEPLNLKKLKSDELYAISRMGLILNHYRKKYPKDSRWFARYHSGTPEHKNKYALKVETSINKIYSTKKGI